MHAWWRRSLLGFAAASTAVLATAPTPPVQWQGSIELARGGGEKGPWRQNQSRYDYVDDPTVALNERGEAFVAWADQRQKDVYFQRFGAGAGEAARQPLNVSGSGETFSWLPRIALAPQAPERVFLLWQEIIFSGGSHGGDMLLARSDDGGATFTAPMNLSNSIGGDGKGRINRDVWHNGSFDIAAGRAGAVYAVWTEYDGMMWFVRSTDGGKSFTRARQIGVGNRARPARAPALAVGNDGTVYLAWTVGEDRGADIRLAHSSDGGATFSRPQIVAASRNYSDAPKLGVDGDGVLHLVYAESSGGPFERYHVRYTRSTDGGRRFDRPRDISTPTPQASDGARFPALAIDGGGNLYVLWEMYYARRPSPYGLAMVVSDDGGREFTPPQIIPDSADPGGGTNGSQQGWLMRKLAVNAAGAIAVVNSSLKDGEQSRVWLTRGQWRQQPCPL